MFSCWPAEADAVSAEFEIKLSKIDQFNNHRRYQERYPKERGEINSDWEELWN